MADSVPTIYSSYSEALRACADGGYEQSDVVKVVIEKNAKFSKSISQESPPRFDLPVLRTLIGLGLVVSSTKKGSINVLDFGGGGGYHYFIARATLSLQTKIQWSMVETTAMAREAKRLENAELTFFDNIERAAAHLGNLDLVFSSGALCYVPDPRLSLQRLLSLNAEIVFITRLPLSNSESDQIILQTSHLSANGPGPLPKQFADRLVKYPCTFVNRWEFEQILSDKYRIRFALNEDKAAFQIGTQAIDMFGYFCERR